MECFEKPINLTGSTGFCRIVKRIIAFSKALTKIVYEELFIISSKRNLKIQK
jgi:hypothetical protein